MKYNLRDIRHNQQGFARLVDFASKTEQCLFDTIEIDMKQTSWFDADMCAAFGAILYRLTENLNTIQLINTPVDVDKILRKNGFLTNYGRASIPDTYGTTIPYHRFETKDERYFAKYIESELITRSELPAMSQGLTKKFRESIFEIFSNAVIHSDTTLGIFSCGQYFPKANRLVFSVADLGIGMKSNIKNKMGLDLSPVNAIEWAINGCNTTKKGPIPGGIGLKLLNNFIKKNKGTMIIVSDQGYWELNNDQLCLTQLDYAFPGTIVTIEIDTSDTRSYVLSSEISSSDIF